MIRSSNWPRPCAPLASLVVVVVLFAGTASAQESPFKVTGAGAKLAVPPAPQRPFLAREPMSDLRAASRPLAVQVPAGRPQRSISRKVAAGLLGAVGGFFAGGYLGAKLEPPCHCDDPGLRGFIIGAPVGAVIGAILGAKFF